MPRYFVTGDCSCPEPTEHEVSKADFVRAERHAGFHNTMGQPDEPATSGFGSDKPKISGRVTYGPEDAFRGIDELRDEKSRPAPAPSPGS